MRFFENNYQLPDGGFRSYTPMLSAIESGSCDLDVNISENDEESSSHPVIKALFFKIENI
jgi:hypothetical protein